jgi:hypothetical protein
VFVKAECCPWQSCPDPTNPCKVGVCTQDYFCKYGTLPGCCTTDADCDDETACTADACASNKCVHTPVPGPGCCTTPEECDDGDLCTADSCAKSTCVHKPGPGCCTADAHCDDGKLCSLDLCDKSVCVHVKLQGTCCSDNDCAADKCHASACDMSSATCVTAFVPGPGCCESVEDCPKAPDSCTARTCELNQCITAPVLGCCTTKWLADDCALPVPYSETWDKGPASSGFTYPQNIGSGFGLPSTGALGPDPHLALTWVPPSGAVERCATSPRLSVHGVERLQVGWTSAYAHGGGGPTGLRVEIVRESAAPLVIWAASAAQAHGPQSHRVEVTGPWAGTTVHVNFCATLAATGGVKVWSIDDLFVVSGAPPAFAAMTPTLAWVGLGEMGSVALRATDDSAGALTFELTEAPDFVSISPPVAHPGGGSVVTLTAQPGTDPLLAGAHAVWVRASDGLLTTDHELTLVVRSLAGILVLASPGVTDGAGLALRNRLRAMGRKAQLVPSLLPYPDLAPFDAVFVTLGVHPHSTLLLPTQRDQLAALVASGGRLYLEGGQAFAGDPMGWGGLLGLDATAGGAITGLTGELPGIEGLALVVSPSPLLNALIDRVEPSPGASAQVALRAADGDPVAVGRGHPSGGRTVASSILHAAITDVGAGDVLAAILAFLESEAK